MRHNQSSLEHHPAARAGKHAALASSAVLLMTVVHHGYGAIRFTTPCVTTLCSWRFFWVGFSGFR